MTIRDIAVLYDMQSYQDMTDEEIDALIDFKINLAVSSAVAEYAKNTERTAYDALMQKTLELVETNREVLNAISDKKPILEVIEVE